MPMKRLKPIRVDERLADPIAEEIEWHLWDLIFKPLLDIMKDETGLKVSLENSKASMIAALRAGRIQYHEGYFTGQFSAAISKDLRSYGAKFDHVRKAFKLQADVLPYDVKQAVIASVSKGEAVYERLTTELDKIEENCQLLTGPVVRFSEQIKDVFEDVDEKFQETVGGKGIEIPVRIDAELREKLTLEYSANLNLGIKTFRDEQVFKLRQQVEDNFREGFRSTEMVGFIQAQYGVSQRKARFLARQETSLLCHVYKTEKYKDVGVTKYQWSASHDSRTRPDHKALDGRVFSYDNPPITDTATGARNNPGQDYGCRCFAGDQPLTLAQEILTAYKRKYEGIIFNVILGSGKSLLATPNHQVLTSLGWKAIGSLNVGDSLVDLSCYIYAGKNANVNQIPPTISEVFCSLSDLFGSEGRHGSRSDFHGDGTDSDIDVVFTDLKLPNRGKPPFRQSLKHFLFSHADAFAFQAAKRLGFLNGSNYQFFSFLRAHPGKPDHEGFPPASNFYPSFKKASSDAIPEKACPLRNGKLAFTCFVRFYNWLWIKIHSVFKILTPYPSVGLNSDSSEMLRKVVRVKADFLRDFFNRNSRVQKFDRVVKVTSENQSLHVYNLQTVNGWYSINGIIAHNCQDIPIVDEELQAEMRKAAPIYRGAADRRQIRSARPWPR